MEVLLWESCIVFIVAVNDEKKIKNREKNKSACKKDGLWCREMRCWETSPKSSH